jgi:hypothetical protein
VAVVVRGTRRGQAVEIRCDAAFPTLYQIRQRGLAVTPIAYATANMAALFVRHFPRRLHGVFAPCALPRENRHAILADARRRGFRITTRLALRKKQEPDEE